MNSAPLMIHQRDPDNLLFFQTPGRAASYLEAIDVAQGEYEGAYDSAGRPFRLVTRWVPYRALFGLWRGQHEVVEVLPADSSPTRADHLSALLRDFLSRHGNPPPPGTPLSNLFERALESKGYVA